MTSVTQSPIRRRSWSETGKAWAKIASRELSTVAITIFGLLLITFFIARVIPIDPVLAVVGDNARPETYEAAPEFLRMLGL